MAGSFSWSFNVIKTLDLDLGLVSDYIQTQQSLEPDPVNLDPKHGVGLICTWAWAACTWT